MDRGKQRGGRGASSRGRGGRNNDRRPSNNGGPREDKRMRQDPPQEKKDHRVEDENYDSSCNEEEEQSEEEEQDDYQHPQEKQVYFKNEDLGISRFMHEKGFGLTGGKIKVIPQDFQVNEVDTQGNVVEIKVPLAAAAAPPVVALPTTLAELEVEKTEQAKKPKIDLLVVDRMDGFKLALQDKLEENDYLQIAQYLVSEDKTPLTLSKPCTNKTVRGQIHAAIRAHLFPLVTSTTNAESKLCLEKANSELLRQDQRRSRNNAAGAERPAKKSSHQRHVSFVLRKINVDSSHCLTEMARRSKLPRKCFQISGTKDKRAVTSQIVSVREQSMRSVQDFTNRLQGKIPCGQHGEFELGDLQVVQGERQFLGNLQGNRFTLAVRDVKLAADLQNLDLAGWKYINYFGAQRFGTGSIGTHQVGVALLNRDYQKTIDMLLQPREGEDEKLSAVREKYQKDGDAKALYDALPSRCTAERAIASGLANKQFGWNVLELVPRNSLTMYLHAVQSLIWNRIANLRLEESSDRVLVGDLVDIQGVRRVTTEEEASKYTLDQVVLPLPGGAQAEYPSTGKVTKQQYDEMAKEMGVKNGLDQFNSSSPRALMLTGGYRALVCVPKQVKFELVRFTGRADQRLLGVNAEFLTPTVIEEGDVDALLVQFTLPAGAYATMALRELLHLK